jgi:hypothetical protein
MYREVQTEGGPQRLSAALQAVLPARVPLEVAGDQGRDAVVQLGSRKLNVRWVGRAGLREVREVLAMREPPEVLVGSEISLAARAAASDAGLGWVDETGAAEIAVGDVIVSRTGSPRRDGLSQPRWSPAVLGAAEALLCGVPATVAAVTRATGHATSSVAVALATLSGWGLLEADTPRGPRSGRRLADPDHLLAEYARAAAAQRPQAELRCGVLWRDPLATVKQLGKRWDGAGVTWAATGALAAAVIAPYLTEIPEGAIYLDVKGEPGLRNAAKTANAEPIAGGRLVVRPFPTQAARLLAADEDGVRVVPWARVYADLRPLGVRGEEAAEHLKELRHGQ